MLSDPSRAAGWRPPAGWRAITTVDAHTAGEPFRVVLGGAPPIPGDSMLAKRRFARERLDRLRTALMWEPRGHADMYGCFLTEPVTPGAHFGVLFMHNGGFSTMCGHGIIAMATVAVETGLVPATGETTEVRIDSPAGLVTAWARAEGGRVTGVRFRNVPAFAPALDQEVSVPGLGPVRYDLAFGGAFYAYVDATRLGLELRPGNVGRLIEGGMAIKRAVAAARPPRHPLEEDLSFLYGTILVGPPESPGAHSRNVCIFAEGEVDRSPTGTGVSGRLAIHFARGEIRIGEPIVVESIIGSRFTGRVTGATTCGPHAAVIPEVEGRAHLVGRAEHWIDPDDELGEGFLVR